MANEGSDSGNIVAIVAIVILAALAVLFFVYGLPALQNANKPEQPQNINVTIPTGSPTPSSPSNQ